MMVLWTSAKSHAWIYMVQIHGCESVWMCYCHRICELACTFTIQTNMAAYELLQAILLYWNEHTGKLWKKLCSRTLVLSCDADEAVQQLFSSLITQTMHYMSHNTDHPRRCRHFAALHDGTTSHEFCRTSIGRPKSTRISRTGHTKNDTTTHAHCIHRCDHMNRECQLVKIVFGALEIIFRPHLHLTTCIAY